MVVGIVRIILMIFVSFFLVSSVSIMMIGCILRFWLIMNGLRIFFFINCRINIVIIIIRIVLIEIVIVIKSVGIVLINGLKYGMIFVILEIRFKINGYGSLNI